MVVILRLVGLGGLPDHANMPVNTSVRDNNNDKEHHCLDLSGLGLCRGDQRRRDGGAGGGILSQWQAGHEKGRHSGQLSYHV
jgi:hypothetical protein